MARHFMTPLKVSILLFIGSFFFSCASDPEDDKIDYQWINFSELSLGQQSKFVLFYDDDYFGNSPAQITGDTIQLSVLGEKDGGFIIKEEFAKYTQFHPSDWCRSLFPQSILKGEFYYVLHVKGDEVEIEKYDDEHIFFSMVFQNQNIREISSPNMTIKNNKPTIMGSPKAEGFTTNLTIQNKQYDKLNIKIDNTEISAEDRGYCVFYNKDYGIVRKVIKYQGSNEAWGWEFVSPQK